MKWPGLISEPEGLYSSSFQTQHIQMVQPSLSHCTWWVSLASLWAWLRYNVNPHIICGCHIWVCVSQEHAAKQRRKLTIVASLPLMLEKGEDSHEIDKQKGWEQETQHYNTLTTGYNPVSATCRIMVASSIRYNIISAIQNKHNMARLYS